MTQSELMDLIAHVEMSMGLAKDVEGFENFFAFWLKSQTPSNIRAIKRYAKVKEDARKRLVKMMEDAGWDKKQPPA